MNGIWADAPVHYEQEYVIGIDFSACDAEKMYVTRLSVFHGSLKQVKLVMPVSLERKTQRL